MLRIFSLLTRAPLRAAACRLLLLIGDMLPNGDMIVVSNAYR